VSVCYGRPICSLCMCIGYRNTFTTGLASHSLYIGYIATEVMTSLHHACLCNTSSLSSSSRSNCSTDAPGALAPAAAAPDNVQLVNKKCTVSSFRIADILTPSFRHFDDVTRSTPDTVTSSDNEEYVEVDDVTTNGCTQQVMTSSPGSGVNALGQLVRMTYNAIVDDVTDHRRHLRRHRNEHYHSPG